MNTHKPDVGPGLSLCSLLIARVEHAVTEETHVSARLSQSAALLCVASIVFERCGVACSPREIRMGTDTAAQAKGAWLQECPTASNAVLAPVCSMFLARTGLLPRKNLERALGLWRCAHFLATVCSGSPINTSHLATPSCVSGFTPAAVVIECQEAPRKAPLSSRTASGSHRRAQPSTRLCRPITQRKRSS